MSQHGSNGIIVKRRTYLAAFGSAAAGAAGAIGSGASVAVWADRDASISIVSDSDGVLGITPGEENGQFVDDSGGAISIDFDEMSAEGFNAEARSTVDDLFRIQNQSGDTQVVWIKDAEEGGPLGDIRGPINFFRGPVKATSGPNFQVISAISPVPGTDPEKQRLSITGLVPPAGVSVSGIDEDTISKLWIESGGLTGPTGGEIPDDFSYDPNADIPFSGGDSGENGGRLQLAPGEEMTVGLDVDATKNAPDVDDTDVGIEEIQVVGRSVENAKGLATEATEFSNE